MPTGGREGIGIYFGVGELEPQGHLEEALLEYLREKVGRDSLEGLETDRLPQHLRPKLRVRNETDEVMAFGEDVLAIKKKLAGELRVRREAAANEEWEMTGGEVWSFGEIPVEAEDSIFPGLVDEGNTVGMRAYLEREEAAESHRAGVVRLFLIEHAEHRQYVRKNFPLKMAGAFHAVFITEGNFRGFYTCFGGRRDEENCTDRGRVWGIFSHRSGRMVCLC